MPNPSSEYFLRIAIDVPLRRAFDYCLPADWPAAPPSAGCRIKVPFGKKTVVGLLLYVHHSKPAFKLKAIQQVLDVQPLLDQHLLDLLAWSSRYYCHAIGEVISSAIPARLRQGKPAKQTSTLLWSTTDGAHYSDPRLANAPRQRALLQYLCETAHGCEESELNDQFNQWRRPIKALEDKHLVIKTLKRAEPSDYQYQAPDFQLNSAQLSALDTLSTEAGRFSTFLLHGVTGSGKTEIYLQSTWRMLQQNKQVLILVPEIGLTPQLVCSFQSRFHTPIGVIHSGLNDSQRQQTWLSARDGSTKIIIGTRSAVFTPLLAPGLIIIDEEHDSSFKQMEGFRYSARDVAIKRAAMLDIPIILGSATPSLESFSNARDDKSTLLHLPDRTGVSRQPDIFRLDMRGHKLTAGLLPHSLKAIEEEIARGGQSLLFLNRRGYAPTMICDSCGWIAECHHCDIRLTVHKRANRLRCHVCSYETRPPQTCPECNSSQLVKLGQGTEKLEETLRTHFPDTGIIRVDRDSTRRKDAFKDIIQSVRSGENKILIGTQMLAKGHHFPQVGTVIIIDADLGLYGLDFRAQEHMAQLITQVAGRAGRAHRQGKVYIQTWHPEHAFFENLQTQPYENFASNLLKERQITGMPPAGFLVLLRVESNQMHKTEDFINQASAAANGLLRKGLELLGPAVAPLERKAGYYRMQLLVKATQRTDLRTFLGVWVESIEAMKSAKKVRWSLDIDPYNLY